MFLQGIKIRYDTFLKYWEEEIAPYDRLERFFRTIKQANAECIFKVWADKTTEETRLDVQVHQPSLTSVPPLRLSLPQDDFVPFIQELLHFHPGLDFLDNHDEFQVPVAGYG